MNCCPDTPNRAPPPTPGGGLAELRSCLLPLLLFNTAIAGLLTILEFGNGFWVNLVFSQSVGTTIGLINAPLLPRIADGWRRWLTMAFSLPASVILGILVGHLLVGYPLTWSPWLGQSLAVGMMFAVIGAVVFLLAHRIRQLDEEVRQRRLDEEAQARRETEARLKLLQAQIEPHFLFNTLATVGSLVDADPPRARRLLDRLNDWLRLTLVRVRDEDARLDDELALLESWLGILGERFGPRLRWHIQADAQARRLPFPPLLLQPLVENAVKHGIEPKLGGGSLEVWARVSEGRLRLQVNDDGVGLASGATGAGPGGNGLENVRARLATLYGDQAWLELAPRDGGGTRAVLELPCAP